jgi:DNA-3-methyladenine glycosylase I
MKTSSSLTRCIWAGEKEPIMIDYHDKEWGVPEHDDAKLLAKLILDGAQAGLSWLTVLKKREGYEKAFHNFDAEKIARYGKRDIDRLMNDAGIVRNKLKIESAIANAKAYLALKERGESFDEFLWNFVDGKTIVNKWNASKQIPAQTKESEAMSKALKAEGFRFVGPTIVYAFMQAVGMVNDHLVDCFRYEECVKHSKKRAK